MHGPSRTKTGQTGRSHNAQCPNLTGNNVGLLNVCKIKIDQKLPFLPCIIHQHVLYKLVLQLNELNHVIDVITTIVNFIRARALNHRQFVALLEEHETEHSDIGYHELSDE